MKTCSKCNATKISTPEFFSRSNRSKNGLASWCKICESLHRKIKYFENSSSIKKRNNSWKLANKARTNLYTKKYMRERALIDPIFKLANSLRSRTYYAIKNSKFDKKLKLKEYIGCSIEFLKIHLESKFKPGMSWENHSIKGWHIDHVIPLASAINEKELYSLCHYTNLQPLWAIDNLKKGCKVLK